MAVTAGRTNRLYAWNAYDWKADYKYVPAGWTVTPTPGPRDATVAITPPVAYPKTDPVSGLPALMGILFGNRSGQGYDRKSTFIAAAVAGVVRVSDLSPVVSYYMIPIMRTVDGTVIRGPESTLTTPTLPAPIISGVVATPFGGSATIAWTTNIPADERIDWGTTTAYGGSSVDANLGLNHSETAQPLLPATLYHYKITSRRETGEASSTSDATFTTL